MREHSAAITFLTEDAFFYYLPAFLIATVDDRETADIIPDKLPQMRLQTALSVLSMSLALGGAQSASCQAAQLNHSTSPK